MSVAQDSPVEGYIPSLSKDELAQDMLQPYDPIQRCRIATLKGCATEGRCPVPSPRFPGPSSQPPVPSPRFPAPKGAEVSVAQGFSPAIPFSDAESQPSRVTPPKKGARTEEGLPHRISCRKRKVSARLARAFASKLNLRYG